MSSHLKLIFLVMLLSVTFFAQNSYVLDVRDYNRVFRVLDNASNDLDLTDYTVEFWFLADTTVDYKYIMSRELSTNRGGDDVWRIRQLIGSNGTMKMQLHVDNGGTDGYVSIDNISLNTWHFISFTYDNSIPRLVVHLDGQNVATRGNSVYAMPATDDTLFFFGRNGDGYSAFDGVIDEIRVSNVARYGYNDYTVSKTDPPFTDDANTVLLYDFDEIATPPADSAENYTFTHLNGVDASGLRGIQTGDYKGAGTIGGGLPLPVELTSFTAAVMNEHVILTWQTATEINNLGFEIQRKNEYEVWKRIAFVEGMGNSNHPKTYTFTDNMEGAQSPTGKYSYRLKQMNMDGSFEFSEIVEVNVGSPEKFELMQNYPNPFNPTTTIKYTIPSVVATERSERYSANNLSDNVAVTLNVYNMLGQKVATLVNEKQSPGNYRVRFDASDLPSGVYLYTLKTGNFVATKKMLYLK